MADKKMRRDSEPDRKSRADERKQLEQAVASLDNAATREEDNLPLQDNEREPDGAQPFATVEK